MAGLLATLGGNPFNTPVGQKIEQATDGSLASENWALNMEICDMVNETDEGLDRQEYHCVSPKDAVKAIRKRLQQNAGKNYTVVMYTLTVLETCVKNCGKRFHLLVTQKDFVQDLVKLIGPKNDPPTAVQEKVLSLIQSWAETFRSIPEMQGVVQVYTDLKQKGIEFPSPTVDTMAPIHTPSRSVPMPPPPPAVVRTQSQETPPQTLQSEPIPVSETGIHPQQLAKLRKELDIVQGNMRVFGEMLTELTPGKEHPSDVELLQDLHRTCQSMQSRIVELLDKVGNEEITGELLQVNDELNNLFLRYERFEKKRVSMTQSRSSSIQSPEEPKPLIDLGNDSNNVDLAAQIGSINFDNPGATASPSKKAATQNAVEMSDEFDMLAQSRTLEHRKTSGVNDNDAAAVQNTDFQREQDFQEMERWLQDKPDEAAATPEGISNADFERFLEERAAAAERLPSKTTQIKQPSIL